MKRSISTAAALLALAACGSSQKAPWLTYPGYDGHAAFPLRASAHEGLVCNDCHVTGVTNPTSFKQFTCTGCHLGTHSRASTDPWHSSPAVPDYAWDSAGCFRCHPQGQAFTRHGLFFPVGGGTKHNRVCSDCHATDPALRKVVSSLKCVGCHTGTLFPPPSLAARHSAVKDYLAATVGPADCLRCHDDGQVDRVATHGRLPGPGTFGTAGPADGDHGAVACLICHNMVPPSFGGPQPGIANRPWAQDWKSANGCSKCH